MLVNRKIVLDTLLKHETLTLDDITKSENLGLVPDKGQLQFILHQLRIKGFIVVLTGAVPATYTITTEGIQESERLAMV